MLDHVVAGRHIAVQQAARRFVTDHLQPGPARDIAVKFGVVAEEMLTRVPSDDPEVTRGLTALAEARDAFMRAAIYTGGNGQ